jgi:hypothetical protein
MKLAAPLLTTARRQAQLGWRNLVYAAKQRWLHNPASRWRFEQRRPALVAAQARVVDTLARDGIALASAAELGVDAALLGRLRAQADRFLGSDRFARARAAWLTQASQGKEYLVRLHDSRPLLEAVDPLLAVGLSRPILDVVNSALGLWAHLSDFDLWYTCPPADARAPVASQRWHRDPDDERIVKVFLYLSDVDESAGPLHYIRRSFVGGAHDATWSLGRAALLRLKGYGESYPPQPLIEQQATPEALVRGIGPAGTLVFCNTTGFHRGGYCTGRERLLCVWTFVPPSSMWPRRVVSAIPARALATPEARFALPPSSPLEVWRRRAAGWYGRG